MSNWLSYKKIFMRKRISVGSIKNKQDSRQVIMICSRLNMRSLLKRIRDWYNKLSNIKKIMRNSKPRLMPSLQKRNKWSKIKVKLSLDWRMTKRTWQFRKTPLTTNWNSCRGSLTITREWTLLWWQQFNVRFQLIIS